MIAKERRAYRRRQKRRKSSPYSNFTKFEISLINDVKDSDIWAEKQKCLPGELKENKEFQKKQFDKIIQTFRDMQHTTETGTGTGTGTETGTETETETPCPCQEKANRDSLAHEFVQDVLHGTKDDDCPCQKKKYCMHFGIGFLLLALLIYLVFIKKK